MRDSNSSHKHYTGWLERTGNSIRLTLVGVIAFSLIALSAQAQRNNGLRNLPVSAKQQAEIIDSLTEALNMYYIFGDVAKDMEKQVRKNYKSGKYKKLVTLGEFTGRISEDFRSVSNDLHLYVRPEEARPEGQSVEPTEEEREEHYKQMVTRRASQNFGFQKLELLEGNVGYLDLRGFNDASYAGKTAIAAMNYLANSDALIIDLRQNGGGSPSMIQLITSYFFDERQHLNSFYIRHGDKTEQYWTQANVQGEKMTETPIYILTSNRTFSAAEEFTYNLKNMKRATIVGQTTGGGAHPVEFHTFVINGGLNVGMSLPFGRAINPITGTNWEGVGVAPDIETSSEDALNVAHTEALKNLLETETDENKKFTLNWGMTGLQCRLNTPALDEQAEAKYAGQYGPRKIWFEDGGLRYQREEGPIFQMTPMGDGLFMFADILYFRIQFVSDMTGKATELVGMYDDGRTDGHKRADG